MHLIPDTDTSGWNYITSKLQKQYPAGKPASRVCSQASTVLEPSENEQAVETMKKMGIKVSDYAQWQGESHADTMEGVLQSDLKHTLPEQEISQAHCH